MSMICITGIWHQGAVLSACLADLGNTVHGVCDDDDAARLRSGRPLVLEPELPELLERNVRAGRLSFGSDLRAALVGTDFAFISNDTPVDENDEPDLRPIFELARQIAAGRSGDLILCVTAQVPVGTTEELGRIVGCPAVYVPEFLRLGTAVDTFRNADRFVIGADDAAVAARVGALFAPLGRPLVVTGTRSAEMAKHAANAFLAASISFANELADIAGALGADPHEVGCILKLDRRIGPHAFLAPGLGYAGGTLGRELRVLQQFGRRHDRPTRLLDAVVTVNDGRAGQARRQLGAAVGRVAGTRVAVIGLTYKAGTSTLRRSVSLEIARDLLADGAEVTAYDPLADLAEVELPEGLRVLGTVEDAAIGCDALLVMNDLEGGELELGRIRSAMRGDVLVDARGAVDARSARRAGFRYVSLWAGDGL